MTVAALLLGATLLAQGHGTKVATGKRPARAAETQKRSAAPAPTSSSSSASSSSATTRAPAAPSRRPAGPTTAPAAAERPCRADGKTYKSKTYNFGAMDVEGKLKTPQLLYFLNRVKLELDMSAPDTRSFMKELEKSADDKNL